MTEKKVDVLMSEMSAIRGEINTTKETVHNILTINEQIQELTKAVRQR